MWTFMFLKMCHNLRSLYKVLVNENEICCEIKGYRRENESEDENIL